MLFLQNIKKAKTEIERLEKEDNEVKTNGSTEASNKTEAAPKENDAVAEVTEELKDASVEDSKQ